MAGLPDQQLRFTQTNSYGPLNHDHAHRTLSFISSNQYLASSYDTVHEGLGFSQWLHFYIVHINYGSLNAESLSSPLHKKLLHCTRELVVWGYGSIANVAKVFLQIWFVPLTAETQISCLAVCP